MFTGDKGSLAPGRRIVRCIRARDAARNRGEDGGGSESARNSQPQSRPTLINGRRLFEPCEPRRGETEEGRGEVAGGEARGQCSAEGGSIPKRLIAFALSQRSRPLAKKPSGFAARVHSQLLGALDRPFVPQTRHKERHVLPCGGDATPEKLRSVD